LYYYGITIEQNMTNVQTKSITNMLYQIIFYKNVISNNILTSQKRVFKTENIT